MVKQFISIEKLLQQPVCYMNGEEFAFLITNIGLLKKETNQNSVPSSSKRQLAYGIKGIAETFGCSIPTANRIKKSGIIDDAISQIGRKIVIDAELALKLANEAGSIKINNKRR